MNTRQDDLFQCLSKTPKSKIKTTESLQISSSSEQTDLDSLQKPLSDRTTSKRDDRRIPTELHHRWEEKRRLYHIRQRTLFRIYISKWWFKGLEWFEYELLLILANNLDKDVSFLQTEIVPAGTTVKGSRIVYLGGHHSNTMEIPSYEICDPPVLAAYLTGEVIFAKMTSGADTNEMFHAIAKLGEDIYFDLYNLQEFQAVWKLRSFQSLRDVIFVPFQTRELGKKGIRRPRIRGYTDGRGSAGDPKRTRMARQVDVVFWQDRFEKQWNDFFTEIEKLAHGFTDPQTERY